MASCQAASVPKLPGPRAEPESRCLATAASRSGCLLPHRIGYPLRLGAQFRRGQSGARRGSPGPATWVPWRPPGLGLPPQASPTPTCSYPEGVAEVGMWAAIGGSGEWCRHWRESQMQERWPGSPWARHTLQVLKPTSSLPSLLLGPGVEASFSGPLRPVQAGLPGEGG